MRTLWKDNLPVYYFDATDKSCQKEFEMMLFTMIEKHLHGNETVVLICIGSDRATGDCLGPIIGYKLAYKYHNHSHFTVYGTLESPVHAKNLEATMTQIKTVHKRPFIIAIDASLGSRNHIGYVTLSETGLQPGIGVDKELPTIGDISITGIVNFSGVVNQLLLQTTRLHTVMQMADFIVQGFSSTLTAKTSVNLYRLSGKQKQNDRKFSFFSKI